MLAWKRFFENRNGTEDEESQKEGKNKKNGVKKISEIRRSVHVCERYCISGSICLLITFGLLTQAY